MKEIIVTTQAELDALPESFPEYTQIIIKAKERLCLRKALGNSRAELWENSSAVLRENSSAVLRGNSSAELWENSIGRVFSSLAKLILHGFSVAFLPVTINLKIEKKSKHAHVQVIKDLDWFERNAVEKTAKLTLYKRVSGDFKTQENTRNETLWSVGSTVTHPNWNPENGECGEGKFHACSRPYFCDEFRSVCSDRYLAISVALKDVYEWKNRPSYPHKIGFRKGKVLYECDRMGKEIKAAGTNGK